MRRDTRRYLWLLASVLVVAVAYIFIGSAGRPGHWPVYMTYYDMLAEAFRAGNTYIAIEPSPALLAKANPHDPAHTRLWLWDASLHGDKYYFYWGPVPALLQAAAKSLLGIRTLIGDQYLVCGFFLASAVLVALLLERLGRTLLQGVPHWLLALAVFAVAFANPAPHLIASGGVYQASIAGGQAFTLCGIALAFDVVWRPHSGRWVWRLTAVGTAWALAMGSRISLLPTLGLLCLVTLSVRACSANYKLRRFAHDAVMLGAPLTVAFALLLTYNKVRFDDWLEFGTNNQLSGLKFRLSSAYWLANLYSYTLRPFVTDCTFPYAMAPWYIGKEAFPAGMELPRSYLVNEPVVGWLRIVPATWLMLLVPPAIVLQLRRWQRSWVDADRAHWLGMDAASFRILLWCVGCFGTMATISGLPVLGLYMATMRYLGDVTPGLTLLGVLGALSLYEVTRSRMSRALVGMAFAGATLATCVFGLLLGYQGYTGHFKTFNTKLHAKVVHALSVCEAAPPSDAARPRS